MEKIVLFVDDELAILNSIKRVFRKSPYTILTANCGEEALEIVRNRPVSVLVSDYSMPGVTGAKLLSEAKKIRPEMIRLILSGNNDQIAAIESINQGGAARFLTKPWDDKELFDEVERALVDWETLHCYSYDKSLLKQDAFISELDEYLSHDTVHDGMVACIALRNIDQIKNNSPISELDRILSDLAPSAAELGGSLTVGVTNDHHFCVLIKRDNEETDLNDVIRSVISKFNSFVHLHDQKIPVVFDIGYTVIEGTRRNGSDLLSNAYMAMQLSASTDQEALVEYTENMGAKNFRQLMIESNLSEALANKEFILHYQPKINLSDQRLCGAEALIRWNSALLGVVPPFDFIPLAESSKLIHEIGAWVIAEAFSQWECWFQNCSVSPTVSINVSPKQLSDPFFYRRLEAVIKNMNIPPNRFEIEITENLGIDNLDESIDLLKKIKSLGLNISLDDFGTGYSSLSYLNKLPIDTIKIDRSFIFPMHESEAAQELVGNLIKLGHDIGLEVVAEGVENETQLSLLKDLGCDVIQGYFFSPPIPPEEFYTYVADYSAEFNCISNRDERATM